VRDLSPVSTPGTMESMRSIGKNVSPSTFRDENRVQGEVREANTSAELKPMSQTHTPTPQVFGVRLSIPYEHAPQRTQMPRQSHHTVANASPSNHSKKSDYGTAIQIVRERSTMTDSVNTRTIAVSTRQWQ